MSWLRRLLSGEDPSLLVGDPWNPADYADPFAIPVVVAARQLIADTVSQFPLVTYDAAGQKLEPQSSFIRRPNPGEPAGDTFERIVNGLTRHGNATLRVTATGSNGFPIALEYVAWNRVAYELDSTGTRFTSITIDGNEQDRRLVQIVPFILDGDAPVGTSPLCDIDTALVKLNRALEFSADYYGAANVPPYALVSQVRLGDGKAEELMAAWKRARQESRPAVLSGDITLETFKGPSAADALVLDAINYLDATVARVMQCPPSLLNTVAQSSLTYSTTRDEYRRFLLSLNASYLKRLESAFTNYLPRGQTARFDTSSLTKLDEAEQLAYDVDQIAAGIVTVEEVRARRGLVPLTEQETADVI